MHATQDVVGHLWFVRRGAQVSGPFPIGALRQEDALGRLRDASALSPDGKRWYGLQHVRTLLEPSMEHDPADQWNRQRNMARARWADQRNGVDRRAAHDAGGQERRTGGDRRTEFSASRERSERRDELSGTPAERKVIWIVLALVGAVVGGAATYGTSNPVPVNLDVRPRLQ